MVGPRAHASNLPDAATLEAFFDAQLGRMLEDGVFPGAAVVVVKGDQVVLAKGYGLANRETGQTVDPQRTLFRMGSISKLLTAILVLQRTERGEMDLDADVNRYLRSLKIDSPPGQPTTLRHLLTHTEGLDPSWGIGGAVIRPQDMVSLSSFLRQRMPPRILPPGEAYVYHDAGLALAGLAVEDQSGLPFGEVVKRDIFDPLGMTRSTFAQPLPDELARDLAVGYRNFNGTFQPTRFEYMLSIPTAAMSATPMDLAKLMIVLLNEGRSQGVQLLQPQTVATANQVHFAFHPALPGAGLACYERLRNGHRTLQHGGLTLGYTNLMILVPEWEMGILLCGNALAMDAFDPVAETFFETCFPRAEQDDLPLTAPNGIDARHLAERVEGRYRYVAHSHHTLGKVSVLGGLTREFGVYVREDGALLLGSRDAGSVWLPIEPGLFASQDLRLALIDEGDDTDRIDLLAVDLYPFKRIAWWEDRRLHWGALVVMVGVFLLSCASAGWRYWYKQDDGCEELPRYRRLARQLAVGGAGVNLLFIASFFGTVALGDLWNWFYGLPIPVRLTLALPVISAAMTIAAVVISGISLLRERWPIGAVVRHLAVLSAMVLFGLFCAYWNLLAITPKV